MQCVLEIILNYNLWLFHFSVNSSSLKKMSFPVVKSFHTEGMMAVS